MAFYKRDGDDLQIAPTCVFGPEINLRAESRAGDVYPIAGWYWFDTLDAAMAGLPRGVTPGSTLTLVQLKLGLLALGKFPAADVAINGSTQDDKIAWLAAGEFERSSPLIARLAAGINLTSAQVDALFISAASIEV